MNPDIEKAIRQAGEIVLGADHEKQLETNKTGPRDFVTMYDRKVQSFLFEALSDCIPGLALIGEEDERREIPSHGPFCIIDPIDGTANFVKDIKRSCISIAYGEEGRIVQGYVLDPYIGELFCAAEGEGAFVNGTRIVRKNDVPISGSMVCFGTSPYDASLSAKTFAAAELVFNMSLDVRRTGTAALDLCYSAANRFDLFFEGELSPWDHAAGALIVREAGGKTVTFDGSAPSLLQKCSMVSGSAAAVDEFLALVESGRVFSKD